MKSIFPYLIMAVLFLAGIRLVDRQQKYTSSTPAASGAFTSMLAENASVLEMQPLQIGLQYIDHSAKEAFRRTAKSMSDTGLTSPGKQQKQMGIRINEH